MNQDVLDDLLETLREKKRQSVESVFEFIKIAALTNDELKDLQSKIETLIVYKYSFNGVDYELKNPPIFQEEELCVDEKEEFKRLVVPVINTRSFDHINNFHDLAVALQLMHKESIKIIPAALKFTVEKLLEKVHLQSILSKSGRRKLKEHFRKRAELISVDVKDFIRALKNKRGDIFIQVAPLVTIALIKIILLFI